MLRSRRGVSLPEVIVTAVILATLGVIILVNTGGRSDAERVDKAARTLGELADACCRWSGTGSDTSFIQSLAANPLKLSQLTNNVEPPGGIPVAELNSCKNTYVFGGTKKWRGPYYHRFISPPPNTKFKLADGFTANDTLVRIPAISANVNLTPGILSIVLPELSQADALALKVRLDGHEDATRGHLRYILPGGGSNDPVTASFYINIHGC